jgi:hypothetical protein
MKATIRSGQEEMKATINSIQSELEKTIKRRMKDVLASVNQCTQGLCEEFNVTEQMQSGLQAVTLYLDNSVQETQTDIQTMKVLMETPRHRLQTNI